MGMLTRVTRGRVQKPHLILLYGPDGVGKSSFGAAAPKPIFLGSEQGTDFLDVDRLPPIKMWADVHVAISELRTEKHDYETLVIDSLDWLEPILYQKLCEQHQVSSIEYVAGGYGKGYVEAIKLWNELIHGLNTLREQRKMNIVLICHSEVVPFHDPTTNTAYDRYQLKLYKKASALFREYVDTVLFANYEVFTKKEGGKSRAYGDGARVLFTERRPAFDAKNRVGLPFSFNFDWPDYEAAVCNAFTGDAARLVADIHEMLKESHDAAFNIKVLSTIEQKPDDQSWLLGIKNKLRIRLEEMSNAAAEIPSN